MNIPAAIQTELIRATSTLYDAQFPLPTNLWCIQSVRLVDGPNGQEPRYVPIRSARNPTVQPELERYVQTLEPSSVDYFTEADYLRKFYTARNLYAPESLRLQADVAPWFMGGPNVPQKVMEYLIDFWERMVPKDYKALAPADIACPRYEASAGACVTRAKNGAAKWECLTSGPRWSEITAGTEDWEDWVIATTPKEWLSRPITDLQGAQCLALEALTCERPVIRTEGGPSKVRWARSSSKNVYIAERSFMRPIQDNPVWNSSLNYIGKASNVVVAALCREKFGSWYIGTHGDDWIAWCPSCKAWHSGDWSNFDLRVGASQQLASFEALYRRIVSFLTEKEKLLYYALSYLSIRAPTVWLWDRAGKNLATIRRTLGKVRSGDGWFVMHNNAINSAVTRYLLETTHAALADGMTAVCLTPRFKQEFSERAKATFGWVAKPAAQFSSTEGFVACRCMHTQSFAGRDINYFPRPSMTSVMRNYVNPAYDPEEFPGSTHAWQVTRLRDLAKTLVLSPGGERFIDLTVDVAVAAGVRDPHGDALSEAQLSRAVGALSEKYSTRSYLEA